MFAMEIQIRAVPACSLGRLALLSALLATLASCVMPNIANWPDSVPPPEVFLAVYAEDEKNQHLQSQTEYLEWTLSFYQGNLVYQSGWEDIRGYVFEAPSEQQRAELLAQLNELGVAIGAEWAKHNDLRLIDSRMLSLWGSTIQLAPDFETQQETVVVIADDVEKLLSGNLPREEIHEMRYSTILGIDLFEGF